MRANRFTTRTTYKILSALVLTEKPSLTYTQVSERAALSVQQIRPNLRLLKEANLITDDGSNLVFLEDNATNKSLEVLREGYERLIKDSTRPQKELA